LEDLVVQNSKLETKESTAYNLLEYLDNQELKNFQDKNILGAALCNNNLAIYNSLPEDKDPPLCITIPESIDKN